MKSCSDCSRRSGLVLALFSSLFLQAPTAAAESSLADLISQYEAAKKEWKASRARKPDPDRGGGWGRGGRRGRQAAPRLEPILESIARLGTDASLSYLVQEYRDPEPEIASLCGAAILKSGHKNAVPLVTAGFDRGGNWSAGPKVRVLDALAKTEGDAGFEFVLRLATRGNEEARLLALGSLGLRPDDERGFEAVLKALADRSTAVRKAALRALKLFPSKAAVSPLIERLGRESDPELRVDVAQALVDRTGQNMGLEARDWKKWWETAEPGFAPDQKPSGNTVVVTPDLSYFGIGVTSKRVSFLVDASRSMLQNAEGRGEGRRGGPGGGEPGKEGERKIDRLKTELARILGELPEESLVNIIPFTSTPRPWKKELHSLKGGGRDEAIQFVRGLMTDGGTNIYDALELALNDARVDTIYLLSDGLPIGGKYTEPADIQREIGAINRLRGAKIHCIGFGPETTFLKDLAAQNGGEFRLPVGGEPDAAGAGG